jgi:hypothetical protein
MMVVWRRAFPFAWTTERAEKRAVQPIPTFTTKTTIHLKNTQKNSSKHQKHYIQ